MMAPWVTVLDKVIYTKGLTGPVVSYLVIRGTSLFAGGQLWPLRVRNASSTRGLSRRGRMCYVLDDVRVVLASATTDERVVEVPQATAVAALSSAIATPAIANADV